jgi:NADH:ubiquinone oxidoreductase subunit 3 (subunit A)
LGAQNMTGYFIALLFLVFGGVFVVITIFISSLVRPTVKQPQKYDTYECGEVPIGGAWIQFNNRFYIVGLIFLIFDVEIVFLYPWALVFKDIGLLALIEMFIFLFILIAGLAYVWVKGDLDWVKPQQKISYLAKPKGE